MEPTKKAPEIERLLGNRMQAITRNHCVAKPFGCGKPISEFTDDKSKREYTISGLCQACQDIVFGKPVVKKPVGRPIVKGHKPDCSAHYMTYEGKCLNCGYKEQ